MAFNMGVIKWWYRDSMIFQTLSLLYLQKPFLNNDSQIGPLSLAGVLFY